ncbi:Fic family protein [Rhodococcus wratislaviensis]|uniref:Fic family protein n=1 Tax=Rhodococcus wratislaviensis TaxID=44752 RepID=UPI0036553C40
MTPSSALSATANNYLRALDHAEFTTALAEYWGDLTLLHPFVDGNSRTQKVFVDQLAHQAGWAIDWREINVGALQSARTFSFVDQGKILGDILGSVIVEKDSIPVDVVAGARPRRSDHRAGALGRDDRACGEPVRRAVHMVDPTRRGRRWSSA